ncbi:hypothetical protein [Mangrovihabitans endophyticus]|uniref:hypothetical protein n=1 Tax=Mangrovihabitans endophyticus TaxID=1751298 RepID=UPI00166561E9|nr:hypothetical protein [Mangrovihabitans endophyticus]
MRDLQGALVIALQGVNLAASMVTLTTLKQYAPALAAAIRGWRLRQHTSRPIILTAKGEGVDLTIELPPNVGTQRILEQLAVLLDQPD